MHLYNFSTRYILLPVVLQTAPPTSHRHEKSFHFHPEGLKGKLTSNISYNVSGRYLADRSKALFRNNEITLTSENYTYGNSFGIVYDNVKTLGVSGEINVDVNRNFKLALKVQILFSILFVEFLRITLSFLLAIFPH